MNPYYPFGLNPSRPPLVRGGVRFALPLRFAPPPFSKWVVIPHFEKGGLGGIYDFPSYSCSGIFAMPAKLIQPFTVVFQDKFFAAMAGEVLE